jgi:hypothetical protein
MIFECRHYPEMTGRKIRAEFGKGNLPKGVKPVKSIGQEATCRKCGALLIVHEVDLKFAVVMTELEDVCDIQPKALSSGERSFPE